MSGGGAKAGRRLVFSGASKKAKKIEHFSFLRSFFLTEKSHKFLLKNIGRKNFAECVAFNDVLIFQCRKEPPLLYVKDFLKPHVAVPFFFFFLIIMIGNVFKPTYSFLNPVK